MKIEIKVEGEKMSIIVGPAPGGSGGDGFTNPANTNDWTVQESTWVASGTEGELDLTGSPTQSTTLTANTTVTFAGVVAATKARSFYFEVTHAGFTLDIPAVNDPAGDFPLRRDDLMVSKSAYTILMVINSAGVPQFAGAM